MKILITDGAGCFGSHFCEKYDKDNDTFCVWKIL
jgi:nucleoside-diphosphate-sugar epimerase